MKGRTSWLAAVAIVASLAFLAAANAQRFGRGAPPPEVHDRATGVPQAEFHMARLAYSTRGCAGSRGRCNTWWAIDYPSAELHFLPAVERLTRISVSDDSIHLEAVDARLFDHPWLFVQQIGQGYWNPSVREAELLREYLLRGGFMVVDDFHGDREWPVLRNAMAQILPGRSIVDIPDDDMLMQILFSLDNRTQIPGQRHIWGQRMQGPPRWAGIYDDDDRLMVAINFNIDMGDAWEHADDPGYPAPMTGTAYRFGVNYVIYAMTH